MVWWVAPANGDTLLAPDADGQARRCARLDLGPRRCSWISGLLGPTGLLCRVLVFLLVSSTVHRRALLPLDLTLNIVGPYRAQGSGPIWGPGTVHNPGLGKPEAAPTHICRMYTPPRRVSSIVRPVFEFTIWPPLSLRMTRLPADVS